MRNLIVLLCLSVQTNIVYSAGTNSPPTVATADFMRWGSTLILVLAIFFLCVWLVRKSGHFTSATASQMRVISGLSIGAKERLVLLQLGEKQLLLGVTPGRIDTLHILEGDDCLQLNSPQSSDAQECSFSEKLMQAVKGQASV